MRLRILGLDPRPFLPLFGRPDADLQTLGVRRLVADATPGFPDRVELTDAAPGEAVLLLNYQHQPAATPYRSAHAIFVREGAMDRYDAVDVVPQTLRARMLSVRGFTTAGELTDADLVDGADLPALAERLLRDPATAYLHAHFAKRGCYAARIERG